MKNAVMETGRSLREIEAQVWAEGQEWMRQRLQQELQKEADQHGRVFPPERPAALARQSPAAAAAHQRRPRGADGAPRD
jgi:hypothetical protein